MSETAEARAPDFFASSMPDILKPGMLEGGRGRESDQGASAAEASNVEETNRRIAQQLRRLIRVL